MSGTSVDGVDAVVADFASGLPVPVASSHLPFSAELRAELQALQRPGADELDRGAAAANALMDHCARAVGSALDTARLEPSALVAIGCHGQTVRHRPERGYTLQLANPARLVEATGTTVVADFRSRDVAAGGQGAPLLPALHAALFADTARHRVVVNLGGIANITDLPPQGHVIGFDVGPGNTLMDAWCERHIGRAYDVDGAWAGTGRVIPALLQSLKSEAYFARPAPKSTGRDLFSMDWLAVHLPAGAQPADVQRTLLALTAETVAEAITGLTASHSGVEIIVCGGGARNLALMGVLAGALAPRSIRTTEQAFHIPVDQVEALGFAWLARETLAHRPGNLPSVTGARGPRILGAIYPA